MKYTISILLLATSLVFTACTKKDKSVKNPQSLAQTLKERADASAEKMPQPVKEVMADAIRELKESDVMSKALKKGGSMPEFTLPDANGKAVSSKDLLAKGPLVVVFYRGGWCPYCNLQLRALQNELETIHSLGAELVAISPQTPDESLSHAEIVAVGYPVLGDQDAAAATQYGVAWEVPEFLLEHMRVDRQLELVKINNGNGTVLPIPAVFVVDQHGKVAWRSVDVDYRSRAEPAEIISVLEMLAM